jgi:hypothetical protein
MKRAHLHILAILAVGVTAMLSLGMVAAAAAEAASERERWSVASTAAHAVQEHLSRLPVSPAGAPSPDHVATLARRVLVTAGVSQDALVGIQPLGDAAVPGGVWHRQQVLVQVRRLSTQQASAVVDAVARTDPSWAVTSIQLNHVGEADTYDASLAVTTLYPAQP